MKYNFGIDVDISCHEQSLAMEVLESLVSGDRELALRCSKDLAHSLSSESEVQLEMNFYVLNSRWDGFDRGDAGMTDKDWEDEMEAAAQAEWEAYFFDNV